MNNITVEQIVTAITTVTIIGGFLIAIYKFYRKNFMDKLESFDERITKLEEFQKMQDKEIKESKKERLILLNGLLACLKGMQEQGCDGPVTQGINDIENYLIEKSHE